jgi:chromosomal replication initiator protein
MEVQWMDEYGDFNGKSHQDYTFENLVVHKGNRLAWAACLAVIETPGVAYNPLFIYGDSGLGKTHLLLAIANAMKARSYNVLYLPSTKIAEYEQRGEENREPDDRTSLLELDAILIDDVHLIAENETVLDIIFEIYNAFYEARKQLVFSSTVDPVMLEGIEERLKNRFTWGLVADLQQPDDEAAATILRMNEGK